GFNQHLGLQFTVLDQGHQGAVDDPAAIHFEEVTQLAAGVTAAEAVGAQDLVGARYPLTDLVGVQLHVVGRGNHRPATLGQVLLDIGQAWGIRRVQAVPAFHGQAIAAQFVEAGDTPDVGADAVVVLQDDRCFAHLPQDGTAAHQLDVLLAFFLGFFQQVHAADNAFFDTFGHRRLGVGFVHHGQVVEDVFLLFHHPARTFANNHRQLVTVGRIRAAAVRDGRGEYVAVPILVLQAFAVQGGAAGGTANQEAFGAAVACGPGQVTDALEAEHRVENVERQ